MVLQLLPLATGGDPVDVDLAPVLRGVVHGDRQSGALHVGAVQLGNGYLRVDRRVETDLAGGGPAHGAAAAALAGTLVRGSRERPPHPRRCGRLAKPRVVPHVLPSAQHGDAREHARDCLLASQHALAGHEHLRPGTPEEHAASVRPAERNVPAAAEGRGPLAAPRRALDLRERHGADGREVVLQLLPLYGWREAPHHQPRAVLGVRICAHPDLLSAEIAAVELVQGGLGVLRLVVADLALANVTSKAGSRRQGRLLRAGVRDAPCLREVVLQLLPLNSSRQPSDEDLRAVFGGLVE
mmetsp:Transcript_47631/g.146782  ORF Transcript_47631/g.146782 Transcript_47631/m.146782 type:complete len:297 (-) Transcript_47631:648-1538(-)